MNDDALAAVVAAAQLLLARVPAESAAPAGDGWAVAGRVRTNAAGARMVARARSRWAMSGRLRE
jgi:hypothetical protein